MLLTVMFVFLLLIFYCKNLEGEREKYFTSPTFDLLVSKHD